MSVAELTEPHDLFITDELHRRPPKLADHLREKMALQKIAAQMVDRPDQVLPQLVELAMEATGAVSAGISQLETPDYGPPVFRWRDLRGEFTKFSGATTPRNHSPCGVCLDRFEPTLTRRPERYYGWIAETGVTCPEVLLAPLYVSRGQSLGTLWVVARREGEFDGEDARVMQELAAFVAIALTMQQDRERLEEAVKRQEMLTAEMSHRVKNVFSVVDAMIRLGKRSAKSPDDMATILSERLHALATAHALVRPSFSPGADEPPVETASLNGLIEAILKPHQSPSATRIVVAGPEVSLGREATTSVALVFHEFATNAVKYGALASEEGRVSISWRKDRQSLDLQWRETGGPAIAGELKREGFGVTMARNAVRQLGGTFVLDWRAQGLVIDFALPLAELAR